jgi:hypothetical protein
MKIEIWLRPTAHASVGIFEMCQSVYLHHDGYMSLGYVAQEALPDLKQQKACFDYIFQSGSCVISNVADVRRKLYLALDYYAIAEISTTLNGYSEKGER